MKICAICSHYAFLEAGEFPTLYHELARQGEEISVIVFSPETTFRNLPNARIFVFPLVTHIPTIGYPLPAFNDLFNRAIKLIKKLDPDVVHTWDYEFLPSIIPWILRKKALDIPQIISADCFPGLSSRWGNTLIDGVSRLYTLSFGKKILLSNDAVALYAQTYISEALTLGVPREKIFVIPPGVDTAFFNPNIDRSVIREKLGLGENDIEVLFVGRLAPVKQVPLLFRVVKRLIKEINGKNVHLILVGDGPYKTVYEEQVQDTPNIRLVGYQKNVRQWFASSDIVVLPSISEGVPNIILEAGACGKPVVASNVGGIPEVIEDDVTGFLFDPNDEQRLYTALKRLVIDDSFREKMGKNARKRMERRFSSEIYAREYLQLYSQLRSHDVRGLERRA